MKQETRKLSMAAEKSDNAVSISDAKGLRGKTFIDEAGKLPELSIFDDELPCPLKSPIELGADIHTVLSRLADGEQMN
jgi:hypothetical protein